MTQPPPGTQKPRRFRPRFHYELIACGFRGHELVGTDAAEVRPVDALVVRDGAEGLRWHRCLRCDSWIPLPPPSRPTLRHPPDLSEVELPLRGRPLRDKFILRLIAIDRALHFVILLALAVLIFVVAAHQVTLRHSFYRVLADFQGGLGGPTHSKGGLVHELEKLLSVQTGRLKLVGAVVLAYAVLEGLEAVGLWLQKRWAEYLTFVATTVLLPLEVYELTLRISVFKVLALVVNVAVVIYLLLAKRLFGLRGGRAAEEELRARDVGWEALERTAPGSGTIPVARPAAQ
jgi:uncharacterized membrane protein (DUF2068 family)